MARRAAGDVSERCCVNCVTLRSGQGKGTALALPCAAAQAKLEAARQRLTPLQERLTRLLATIPIELQRDGLSLS
jgi:hypothetical protein